MSYKTLMAQQGACSTEQKPEYNLHRHVGQ